MGRMTLCLLAGLALAGCRAMPPGPAVEPDPGRLGAAHPVTQAIREGDEVPLEERTRFELLDLLQLAEERNPEIQAAEAYARAGDGAARQAFLPPNPSLQYREGDLGIDPWSWSSGRSTVSVAQPLVLSGRLTLAGRAARADEAARQLLLQQTRHLVYGAVHSTWVEVVYLGEALDLQFEMLQLAADTEAIARQQHSAGVVTTGEMERVTFEERRLAQEVLTLVTRRTNETERMAALLGGFRLSPGRITGSLLPSLPYEETAIVLSDAVERHPELRAARQQAGTALREYELARREWLPDPEVSVGFGNNRNTDENYLEAGVRLPLPLFDRNQGRIDEAAETIRQAEAQAGEVETRLTARLTALLQLLSEVDTLATEYTGTLVPQARSLLDATIEDFRNGTAGTADLIEAQRTYVETRQLALQYRFDLNRYLGEFRHFNLYPAKPGG